MKRGSSFPLRRARSRASTLLRRGGGIFIAAFCLLSGRASSAEADFAAIFRVQPTVTYANDDGALSAANDLLNTDANSVATELELRGKYRFFSGAVTWRHASVESAGNSDDVILNELFANTQLGGWYFTAGKKIMSWDVGYAFRPLDVIQQENRRRLITTTLEGVPLLTAEKFGDNSAWTIVLANPQAAQHELGRNEPAIAVRGYWRVGTADVYAVAREGSATGLRAGFSVAYVANAGLELHASVLRAEHLSGLAPTESIAGIPTQYELTKGDAGWQALIGFSWATENRFSVFGEAYRDERAWTEDGWRAWRTTLNSIAALPIPTASIEGLTAAQAEAMATPSLQRDNLVLRLAWTGEHWSPSADVLYTPADSGAIATARMNWTGDRINAEAGWRETFGARQSIARQLPFERVLYASVDISF